MSPKDKSIKYLNEHKQHQLDLNKYWRDNLVVYNIYQQEVRPFGASFKGSTYEAKISNSYVNHWNIIDNSPVLSALRDVCFWLGIA